MEGMHVRMQLRGAGRAMAAITFGLLVMAGWQAATSASPRSAGQDYGGECPTSTTDYYGGYEGCETTTTGTASTDTTTNPNDTVFPSDTATPAPSGEPLARTGPPDYALPLAAAATLIALVGAGALVRARSART